MFEDLRGCGVNVVLVISLNGVVEGEANDLRFLGGFKWQTFFLFSFALPDDVWRSFSSESTIFEIFLGTLSKKKWGGVMKSCQEGNVIILEGIMNV